jgi:flagellar motor protein MotB
LPNEIIGKETIVSRQGVVESTSLPPQIPNAVPVIPQLDDTAKTEMAQLQKENSLLKEKLKEAEAKAAVTQPVLPPMPSMPEQPIQPFAQQDMPKPLPNTPVSTPKLPAINKQGVTVSQDEQKRTRIEVMDKVLFTPNTRQLTADGEETLRTIAAEIKASQPNAVLEIEGHTDSLVGDPKNETQKHDISSIKSMAVMEFFINTLKWDASKIRTGSYGQSRPVADNGTPEGRARNNRIELAVQN